MSAALKAIEKFAANHQLILSESFPDGTRKELVANFRGPSLRVMLCRGESPSYSMIVDLYLGEDHEEAARIYEAYDGVRRDWHQDFQPRGARDRDGHDATVHAVGSTAAECVAGFCDSLGVTLDEKSLREEEAEPGCWACRFTCANEAFRTSGIRAPGGVIITQYQLLGRV